MYLESIFVLPAVLIAEDKHDTVENHDFLKSIIKTFKI